MSHRLRITGLESYVLPSYGTFVVTASDWLPLSSVRHMGDMALFPLMAPQQALLLPQGG